MCRKTSTFTIFLSALLTSMLMLGAVHCSSSDSNGYGLYINEFMADNGITVAGPDGNTPDWIEIYNAANNTIDLTGMYLTDNLNNPTKWQFPEDTTIGSKDYLIVWADPNGGELYASFALDANGEEIGLFDKDGTTLIDSVVFTKQIQDVSFGRIPDGGSSWNYLLSATPGYSNIDTSEQPESSVWSLVLVLAVLFVAGLVIFVLSKTRQG